MKNYFLSLLLSLAVSSCPAQTDKPLEIFGFPITDYMVKFGDSIVLVQVNLEETGMALKEKQVSLLKANYTHDKEVGSIGSGRCNLIKGTYYYFTIRLDDKTILPKAGDMLYTEAKHPTAYRGQIYKLLSHAIYVERVTGGEFYSYAFLASGDKNKEAAVIDSLVADIKYTGKEMLQQNDGQDRTISKGRFAGKKLFAAMQQVTSTDVKDFVDYVIARPNIYAGNTWKIAEIFATWMDAGTPTVKKD